MEKKNPVIAVTGGANGIGKGILEYFCQRGYDGVVLDIEMDAAEAVARELRGFGVKAAAIRCNVAELSSVTAAYAEIDRQFGRLDVQVNNAGIMLRGLLMDTPEETDDQMIEINLKGALRTSRMAFQRMKEQGGGVIINAHSIVGTFPDYSLGVYGATKAALAHLTRVMAAECAPYHVRVNGYAPCMTATRLTQHIIDTRPDAKLAQIPMRQFGTPEQVAKVCWFLAGDLSDYTTGATIPCDGGAWDVQRPEEAWKAAGKL